MTPIEYCREKLGVPGSSFYYSTLFVPAAKRDALTALQAYFQEIMDVVHECQDAATARLKLAWWREELARSGGAGARHPVGQALAPVIAQFRLPPEDLQAVIDAVDADVGAAPPRTFEELRAYCRQLGGDVALGARILGCTEPAALESVGELGTALQIAHLVCDAGWHARRGRVRFPLEDLERFGVSVAEILQAAQRPGIEALLAHALTRAETLLGEATEGLPPGARVQQLPALTLAEITRATVLEIRRSGYRLLRERTVLPPRRKLWIAWRTARRERARARRLGRRA